MPFDNIKELARQYALAHKTKKTSIESLTNAAEKELLNDDINEYNIQKLEAEKEIKSRYSKKEALFGNFQVDTEKVKDLYLNDIKEQIDFVSKEKVNFQTLVSGSASLQEQLPHFQEIVGDNIDKINSFAYNLNNLQSDIQNDATRHVNNLKNQISKDIDEEKKHLSEELRNYYEEKKEKIDLKLKEDQHKAENRKEQWFGKNGVETFEEMQKGGIFLKFILILLFSAFIIGVDYYLIQGDLVEVFGMGETNPKDHILGFGTGTERMFHYILPGIFSFLIIIAEIISNKIIESKKRKNAILIFVICFTIFLLIGPDASSAAGISGIISDTGRFRKLIGRFAVYVIGVPLTILLINKMIDWNYLKIFLSNIGYRIVRFFSIIFSPITRCINLIRKLVQPIENRVYINLSKFKIKWTGAPRNELEEKLQLANVFFNNMNLLESQINQIKNYTQSVINQFEGGNQVFDKRIKNLREGFEVINAKLNEQIEQINNTRNAESQRIQEIIDGIMYELGQTEDDIKQARLLIKEGVLEAMRES